MDQWLPEGRELEVARGKVKRFQTFSAGGWSRVWLGTSVMDILEALRHFKS